MIGAGSVEQGRLHQMKDAIKADTAFLASQNIMDYSLLLGSVNCSDTHGHAHAPIESLVVVLHVVSCLEFRQALPLPFSAVRKRKEEPRKAALSGRIPSADPENIHPAV